jgi:hypothetical protein
MLGGREQSMNYDEVSSIMGEIEFDADLLEQIILNGKNEKINRYLSSAIVELRRALSDLSDAEFEIDTEPHESLYGDESDTELDEDFE